MNINIKQLIIGAGILLLWGVLGGATGLTGKMTPMIWVAAGLIPTYYVASIGGVAGYIGTFVILWSMTPQLVGA